jgi:hypothetical protein
MHPIKQQKNSKNFLEKSGRKQSCFLANVSLSGLIMIHLLCTACIRQTCFRSQLKCRESIPHRFRMPVAYARIGSLFLLKKCSNDESVKGECSGTNELVQI